MNIYNFLSNNWSQILVIIGGIGYLLQVILNFIIKKREIKFEFLYKEKAFAFKEYLLEYQKLKDELTRQSSNFIYGSIKFDQFEASIKSSIEALRSKLYLAYMFCTQKEKEDLFSILNTSSVIIYKVKAADSTNLADVLNSYYQKTNSVIEKLVKNFEV